MLAGLAAEVEAEAAVLLATEELVDEEGLLPELLLAELAAEVLTALEEAAEVEDCCGVLTVEVLLSLPPPPPPPQANSENDAMVDNNAIHNVLLLLMMLPLLSAFAIMAGHR
jgi:hypothetical protein